MGLTMLAVVLHGRVRLVRITLNPTLTERGLYVTLSSSSTTPKSDGVGRRGIPAHRWLGGLAVRMLDLQSRCRGFDSWLGRIGDCLWTGKSFRYETNHQGQLSLLSLRGR